MRLRCTLPTAGKYLIGGLLFALVLAGIRVMSDAQAERPVGSDAPSPSSSVKPSSVAVSGTKTEKATFGSGCFWCTEAVFIRLKGVAKVVSGYSGGHVKNPT